MSGLSRDEPGPDPSKGPEVEESKDKDEDLWKPHKETLDDPAQSWFDHMPSGGIDNWDKLQEGFVERFALRKRCCNEPIEATRIIKMANETLLDFKEQLARRFANRVPTTITEMMKRVDDFVKSEEAYKSTELSKGAHQEKSIGIPFKGNRPPRQGFDGRHQEVYNVVLESLRKQPKEILATEPQLQLPPCPSTIGTPRKENLDRYCDYHANNGGRGKVINMVWENTNYRKRKTRNTQKETRLDASITFPSVLPDEVLDDPMIIKAEVEGYLVKKVSVDQGAAIQVMFKHCFDNLPASKDDDEIHNGEGSIAKQRYPRTYRYERAKGEKKKPVPEGERAPEQEWLQAKEEAVLVNPAFLDQKLIIRTQFSKDRHSKLINLLINNLDVFTWEPLDMVGVPKRITKHTLNVNRSVTPVVQKQRILGSEKSQAVLKEVQEWLKAGIIRPAHPIKVITDEPIKQILNKPEASGKLAKYAMELGDYNIAYVLRNAIKGQVLADFINEIPAGVTFLEICTLANGESKEAWTLYTDGALSLKGATGLVLIDPSGTEYTYAIRLTFTSTNNEAEYESLLAGLKIAHKIKVQELKAKVDSKLVTCQLNEEFVANSEGMENTWPMKVHEGACRMHDEAHSVVAKIMRQGYYWPTMHQDTKEVIDRCNSCQIRAPIPKLPKTSLTSIMSPWPFYQWGLDILGPLPEGPGKLKNIIVAIDYFTKWMEAKPLATITEKEVNKFVWKNIVCSEVVITVEIGMPTYRTLLFNEAQNEEEMRLNLDLTQERREAPAIQEAKYKKKVEQYYNKRVRPVSFRVGDFVY
nr:hypothetical protein [Tanacetum cinerariifolium]